MNNIDWFIVPQGSTASRPTTGILYINPDFIPAQAESFDSPDDRSFFEQLLRHIFPLLGLHQSLLESWSPPATVITEFYSPYQREFRWLATPEIQSFIGDRFGFTTLTSSDLTSAWPFASQTYGAELAPCDSDICTFFWSDRVFFTEIMAERYWQYARISLLTFSALADTGWYQINRTNSSLFEPLEWGDYRSLGGSTPLTHFPAGQPDLPGNWPPHYLVRELSELGAESSCTYDHRAIGAVVAKARGNCEAPSLRCSWKAFTDSQDLGWYDALLGDDARSPSDFALVRRPTALCRAPAPPGFEHSGAAFGRSALGQGSFCAVSTLIDEDYNSDGQERPACYTMACDNDSQLYILIGKEARACGAAGEHLAFRGYAGYVVCPEPRVICGIDRYGELYKAPATVPPIPSRSPSPEITKPTEGFSLFVFYTLSYVETFFFKGLSHLNTVTEGGVETLMLLNGVWRYTVVMGGQFDGSVSMWSHAWSLSQISWLQVIPSKPYEGRYGINSAGWTGIIISAVALIGFLLGIVYCSRRADIAWRAEQRHFAREEIAAKNRSSRGSKGGSSRGSKGGSRRGSKKGSKGGPRRGSQRKSGRA